MALIECEEHGITAFLAVLSWVRGGRKIRGRKIDGDWKSGWGRRHFLSSASDSRDSLGRQKNGRQKKGTAGFYLF